jgi:hypothetical protein
VVVENIELLGGSGAGEGGEQPAKAPQGGKPAKAAGKKGGYIQPADGPGGDDDSIPF